tara:strand:+ start:1526 stop:1777 length:252 start_codon:yes stop_codon:yes gene_type:complete
MKTIMKLVDLTTIDQPTAFLSGTQSVAFSIISDKDAKCRWIQGELVMFQLGHRRGNPLSDEGQRVLSPADHATGEPIPRYGAA